MARNDYDDEALDEDDIDDGDGPGWRQRLLTWGLAAVGLGLGFLIPYTLYLNHQVTERFGELREGELSRVRASLVRQDALHRIALDLDLGDCLRLGEGELKSGGSRRPSILADAVEALFAAVFLDAGFAAAKAVVDRLYAPLLAEVDPLKPSKDPKTALQEWLQGRRIPVPTYSMVQVIGEAHAQEFEVACEIPKLGVRTLGRGPSRRIAEQQSAELALAAVRKK